MKRLPSALEPQLNHKLLTTSRRVYIFQGTNTRINLPYGQCQSVIMPPNKVELFHVNLHKAKAPTAELNNILHHS